MAYTTKQIYDVYNSLKAQGLDDAAIKAAAERNSALELSAEDIDAALAQFNNTAQLGGAGAASTQAANAAATSQQTQSPAELTQQAQEDLQTYGDRVDPATGKTARQIYEEVVAKNPLYRSGTIEAQLNRPLGAIERSGDLSNLGMEYDRQRSAVINRDAMLATDPAYLSWMLSQPDLKTATPDQIVAWQKANPRSTNPESFSNVQDYISAFNAKHSSLGLPTSLDSRLIRNFYGVVEGEDPLNVYGLNFRDPAERAAAINAKRQQLQGTPWLEKLERAVTASDLLKEAEAKEAKLVYEPQPWLAGGVQTTKIPLSAQVPAGPAIVNSSPTFGSGAATTSPNSSQTSTAAPSAGSSTGVNSAQPAPWTNWISSGPTMQLESSAGPASYSVQRVGSRQGPQQAYSGGYESQLIRALRSSSPASFNNPGFTLFANQQNGNSIPQSSFEWHNEIGPNIGIPERPDQPTVASLSANTGSGESTREAVNPSVFDLSDMITLPQTSTVNPIALPDSDISGSVDLLDFLRMPGDPYGTPSRSGRTMDNISDLVLP